MFEIIVAAEFEEIENVVARGTGVVDRHTRVIGLSRGNRMWRLNTVSVSSPKGIHMAGRKHDMHECDDHEHHAGEHIHDDHAHHA